jgi:hypothetical protein
MKEHLWVIILIPTLILSCNKSMVNTPPVAGFTIDGDTSSTLTTATYDGYSLINNSTNADSCVWNFGNDSIYRVNDVWLYYPRSGNYTLTLTAYAAGKKSVSTRQVHVYDRVLRQVVITSLNMNTGGVYQSWGYPAFNRVNAWVGIQQAVPGQHYTVLSDGTFDAPFIYRSPIQQNVDSTSAPITIAVPGRTIIDIPTFNRGPGYGFNLYVQNSTGTYLLNSTYWAEGLSTSGNGYSSSGQLDPNGASFVIHTGNLGVGVAFIADYEQ